MKHDQKRCLHVRIDALCVGLIRIHYKTCYALVLFMVFAVLCHLSIRMIGLDNENDNNNERMVWTGTNIQYTDDMFY